MHLVFVTNAQGLLAVFEFEKQMYMTIDELKIAVDDLINCPPDISQPVQVYIDGFKDGANFILQKLQ